MEHAKYIGGVFCTGMSYTLYGDGDAYKALIHLIWSVLVYPESGEKVESIKYPSKLDSISKKGLYLIRGDIEKWDTSSIVILVDGDLCYNWRYETKMSYEMVTVDHILNKFKSKEIFGFDL